MLIDREMPSQLIDREMFSRLQFLIGREMLSRLPSGDIRPAQCPRFFGNLVPENDRPRDVLAVAVRS